jgi:ring-1,2-phenylacetyl-CoA epoxidase subunit PaaD
VSASTQGGDVALKRENQLGGGGAGMREGHAEIGLSGGARESRAAIGLSGDVRDDEPVFWGDSEAAAGRNDARERAVWRVLEGVLDPEIPVLSVVELGIVRFARCTPDGKLHVGLTPTYSGCPATEVIRRAVKDALDEAGYAGAVIEEVLSPAWTSDWLSESGRRKLESFGIAPPAHAVASPRHLFGAPVIRCPRCGSASTERVSEFGSTPCKAHYRCVSCLEPFDYFKCI